MVQAMDDTIKRLSNNYIALLRENQRLMAEIERLKAPTTDWLVKGISAEQLEQEKIEALKAHAIKEFAERLNDEFHEYRKQYKEVANFDGAAAMLIAKRGVEIVLKEMAGDNNG